MKLKFKERLRALEQRLGITPGLPTLNIVVLVFVEACYPKDDPEYLLRPPELTSGTVDSRDAARVNRNAGESIEDFVDRLARSSEGKGQSKCPRSETPTVSVREVFLFPELPPAA